MATFNKFNAFVEHVAEKIHDLGADTLKVMLTNVAPAATNSVKADLTEIAAGNGYAAGGTQATTSSSAQSGGTYKLTLADVGVAAAGGAIASFRYALLYNDTPAGAVVDPLIGWWDYGSSISPAAGETFTVDFDATNGVLTIA